MSDYINNKKVQPFSFCEEDICRRKNARCFICKSKIEKGEDVIAFNFFIFCRDLNCLTHPECFHDSVLHSYYIKFKENSYAISDFIDSKYTFKYLPVLEYVLNNFDFEKTVNLIIDPPEPVSFFVMSEVFDLIAILIKCGYKAQLIEKMETMPHHALIFFSMHDEMAFQNKAAVLLNIPQLPESFNILRKHRLTLEDILFLKEVGEKNTHLLKLLALLIEKYGIDHTYAVLDVADGFNGFGNVRNARFCYFFISHPNLLPCLNEFMINKKTPKLVDVYIECYYYRAIIFHLMIYKPDYLDWWLNNMENEIGYYLSGSPKGFINDTKKMVYQYKKSMETI